MCKELSDIAREHHTPFLDVFKDYMDMFRRYDISREKDYLDAKKQSLWAVREQYQNKTEEHYGKD